MAAVNRSRQSHYNQKNTISVFSVEDLPFSYLTEGGGDGCILGVLPPHALIVHVMIIEEVATNANAKFDLTIGGIPVITNGQLDANGLIASNQLDNSHIENGGDIIFSQGTTPPTVGEFTFAIMYIEHLLHTGLYTRYSDA